MEDEITIPTDVLVQHAKAAALEWGECEEYVPDDCDDWSFKSMNVTNVEYDEGYGDNGAIRVHGYDTGSVSRKTARASRHHPAEYESLDVRIHITITLDLTAQSGLGEVYSVVDSEGDPREPPAPDVNKHRYDL